MQTKEDKIKEMDLELEFFKAFSIYPKVVDACTLEDEYWKNEELAKEYVTFDRYMDVRCGMQDECNDLCKHAYEKQIYPAITSEKLIELICICAYFLDIRGCKTPKELKKYVLERAISNASTIDFKMEVRKLFEGEPV